MKKRTYTYEELKHVDVINPVFSVSERDVEKARKGLHEGEQITTVQPYYWALAVQIADNK